MFGRNYPHHLIAEALGAGALIPQACRAELVRRVPRPRAGVIHDQINVISLLADYCLSIAVDRSAGFLVFVICLPPQRNLQRLKILSQVQAEAQEHFLSAQFEGRDQGTQ